MKNNYHPANTILRWLLCLALTVFLWNPSSAQIQYLVVPTGGTAGNTNGSGADPVCRYFNSIRYQVVYTVAELSASGMAGGSTIQRLAWNVTENSVSLGNYTILMGHTAATNSSAHNVDATTTVKTAFTYSVALGYNDIIFDTPFLWNGTSNIVVEICTGPSNPFTSPYGGVQAKTGVTAGSRTYRTDGTSACATSTSSTLTTKPYVRFTASPPPPCSGTPAPGNTISSVTSICPGTAFSLSIQNTTPGTGVTFQWQSNTGSGFSNISGATSSTYTAIQNVATTYQCLVTCAGNTGISTPVSVSILTCANIGTGTTSDTYWPIYTCYGYNYSQQIYTSAEILGAGGYATTINRIRFFHNNGGLPELNWNNWTIYLGNTALNNFSGTADWVPVGSMTQVFSGVIPTVTAGGWYEITLTTPFNYTGGNLVVAVDENTPSYNCTAAWNIFDVSAAAGPRSLLYYSDGTNPDPAAPPTANQSSSTRRAQVSFVFPPPPPCVGTPTPGNTISNLTTVCANTGFSLSLQNPTGGTGVTYQWQSNTGSGFTNISGANASTYTASQTVATSYQCLVTCAGNTGISTPVSVGMEICVGSGTLTDAYLPIYSCYGYNYSQQIYTSAEIIAGGGMAGTMTKIRFRYDNGGLPESTWNDWVIYLGNTALNNFTGVGGWVPVGSLTQVFSGTIPTPVNGQWMEFTLSTPFNYTGGNLIVAVDENLPSYSCTAYWGVFDASAAAGPRSILYYSDGTNPDPSAPPTANYSSTTRRAMMQFAITPPPPCVGTPIPGNTLSSVSTICSGSNIDLSLQNFIPGVGVTYQWQSGPSASGPWTNFGAGNLTQSATLNATTWYQCVVTCAGNSGTSTPVQVIAQSCCNYTFTMIDSYGDGWNGNTMQVMQGATVVATLGTTFTGGLGPVVETVGLVGGLPYTLYWNVGGSWAGEVGISITNSTGTIIYTKAPGTGSQGTTLHSWNASCPPPCDAMPGNTLANFTSVCSGANFTLSTQIVYADGTTIYQWQSGPSATGPWTNFGTNSSSVTTTQTTATWYRCFVTCVSGGATGSSTPIEVGMNTLGFAACGTFCTTPAYYFAPGCGYNIYATNFNFGGINNTTGCNGVAPYYTSYINLIGTAQAGSTYPISVNGPTSIYINYYKVYIDFNDNGSFDDAGELIYNSGMVANIAGPYTGSVLIPTTAATGYHRMRLRVADADVNSCTGEGIVGEVEDYIINVTPPPSCAGTPTPGNTTASTTQFCNNSGSVTLGIQNYDPSLLGQSIVWQSSTNGTTFTNLPGLPASCNYVFKPLDSYGDGWNGNTMEVRQGATVIATLSLATGYTADIPLSLNASTPYSIYYVGGGSWQGEVGLEVYDESNALIYSLGYGAGTAGTTLFSWTTNNCPAPPQSPNYTASQTVTTWYQAVVTCTISGLSAPSVPVQVISMPVPTTSNVTRCGPGTATLSASAPGYSINWYSAPTGGSFLGSGNSINTPFITANTTYYAAAAGGASAPITAPMPAQSTTFSGNVRGYWFTSPTSFTITGLNVPNIPGNQNIAVVRFNPAVPPPAYAGTTNAFDILYITQNNPSVGMIPVNINIAAGDVIGVLGQRGLTNSYYTGSYVTTVNGLPVTLSRLGMQYDLASTSPQELWTEAGGSISIVEFTYLTQCEGPTTPVTVTVDPSPNISVATSSSVVCDGLSVTLDATSSNSGYNYTWTSDPAGYNASGASVSAIPSGVTVYTAYAYDSGTQCGAIASVSVSTTPNILIVSATASDPAICSGESVSLTAYANEGGASSYCLPYTSCTWPDAITDVSFATISNPSVCNAPGTGGLTYFTSYNPTLTAGVSYPLTVSTGGDLEGIAVWVDWNQNNAFEASELQYNSYAGTNPATYNTSILIPFTAYNGPTRMRIRCQYSTDPITSGAGPCSDYTYGETEDYLVTITGGTAPSNSGYSFSWSPATYLSATNISNPTASNVTSPVSYSVTVTSAATGCVTTENLPLVVNPLPEPSAFNGGPYCENQSGNFFGYGGLYYTWSGPNGFSSYDQSPLTANPLTIADGGTYTLTVEDANGCVNSVNNDLIVNPLPVVDYVTATDVTCLGAGDGIIEIGISSGDGSYNTTDGGSLTSFDSPALFTSLTPGTYSFTITDGQNCATTTSAVIDTDPNLPPVITCPGNQTLNNTPGLCGAIYSYTVLAEDACPGIGNVIQTAGLPSGATFPVGTTVNSFIVYDVLGVSATCSFSVTVTDTENPTITNVPASFSSCNPITWTAPTITDNCPGVIIQSSHAPGVFPSGTTLVTYTATDVYGHVSTASFNVTVLEPSIAATSISSSRDYNNICLGESITLTRVGGTLGDGAQWKWYTGSCGGTPVAGSNGLSSITVSPTVTTTYYLRPEGTCLPHAACVQITVVVSTGAPSGGVTYATVPAYGAPGITDVLSVNPVPGASFYQWSTNNGQIGGVLFNGTISPVQTTVPTVNITFVQSQQNYQIRVLAGNACGRTSQANTHIRGTVAAPTSLTGPTQVCPGQTASYTVSAIPSQSGNSPVSYNWALIPANAGTISGSGLTRTVTFAAGFTTAQLCVNGISSFGLAGTPLCITISTSAPIPGAVSGNAIPCSGSTGVYSIAAVPSATSYIWTTNIAGASIVPSGLSASVTFPAGTFSGNVCVQSVSSCGTSAPSCLAVVSGVPGNPGPVSGPSQGICGGTNVNYSLSTSGATYNWILPAGATPSGPTNLNSVNVNFSGSFAGGNITVMAQYTCGAPVASSIYVSGEPTMPTVNPATICANSTELYFASSTGATGYNWTVTNAVDEFCTNPPVCSQYYMEWGPLGGSFSVTASNGCGTSAPFNLSTNCRISANGEMDTKVYPNPNTGQFVVELNSYAGGNHNLTITDLSGRVIMVKDVKATSGLNQFEVDLGFANAGLYMLYVKDADGKISVTKVIVE